MKTTNGGDIRVQQNLGTIINLSNLHVLSPTIARIEDGGGAIFKMVDGAATWNAQTSGTPHPLTSIFFVDGNHEVIMRVNGKIFSPEDGYIPLW